MGNKLSCFQRRRLQPAAVDLVSVQGENPSTTIPHLKKNDHSKTAHNHGDAPIESRQISQSPKMPVSAEDSPVNLAATVPDMTRDHEKNEHSSKADIQSCSSKIAPPSPSSVTSSELQYQALFRTNFLEDIFREIPVLEDMAKELVQEVHEQDASKNVVTQQDSGNRDHTGVPEAESQQSTSLEDAVIVPENRSSTPIDTQSSTSVSEWPAQQNKDLVIHLDHHAVLCHILKPHAIKWREIGLYLGVPLGDLVKIQATPLLQQTAPVSCMNAMLEKFLRDAKDGRVMISVLEDALKKADLAMTAYQLKDDIQQVLVQAVLCHILKLHATKWREIGLYLGFLPEDLDNIQATPSLHKTSPVSWMNAMLEKFLKEAKGGAVISVFEAALNKAGLAMITSQLRDDVQRLLVQAVLCLTLKPHATNWRKIGQCLGLLPGDLDNIQATPLHHSEPAIAPVSRMNAMLEKFLKQAKGGAMLSVLEAALKKAGLAMIASQLRDDIRLLVQVSDSKKNELSTTTDITPIESRHRSQSPKMAAQATSVQYQAVFRANFDRLVKIVGPVVNEVTVKAFAKKLISERHKSDAENPHNNEYDRASKLLERILSRANGSDTHFERFITILREIPVLEDMAEELVKKACEQEPTSLEELPAQQKELTVEIHHVLLCHVLKTHAIKWREIGLYSGLLSEVLDNIQATPLLLQTAPVSWMNAMLEKFLRESKGGAMKSVLKAALNKAKLTKTAFQLRGVPKLNHSPAVQNYAECLKDLYSQRKMPDYLKGRQLRTKNFVSLALISREGVSKEEMDKFTLSTVNEGDVDAIFQKKAPFEMTNIRKLKNNLLATCMLFQGGPGVGKTTLAWNLCREWECRRLFQEYSLVVFIPLRKKAIREAKDIEQLFTIGNSNREIQKAICDEVLKNQGESVLLVLDGYDELPADLQQDSMIADIVCGQLLPKANVLITSRPSVCDKLTDKCHQRDENFQHIEVLGFTKDKINAYIEDNVQDPKQLKQFHEYQSSHPKIYTMMYNPLQCALTVEVCKKIFADGSGLPNTRTKLYETNVLMTMSREHSSLGRINSLRKLPQAFHKNFVELCHLAYNGTLKRRIIFEDVPEEIKQLGLLVCEPDIDSLLPSSENYNFFHLTIQEFCAAYYICSLPEQQQQKIIQRHCREYYFREVVIFVCGISANPKKMVDIVYSCLNESTYYSSKESNRLLLLHCAFESQCANTCTNLMRKLRLTIDLREQHLTPSDMSVIGFFVSKSKAQSNKLNLNNCSCGDDEVQALISQFLLTQDEHSSLSKTINLSNNNIGADGAKCFSEGLKYCPELQELYLSYNNIGDDGAKCLSERLKYCPKLQTLSLRDNSIGDDGAKCLSEGLKHYPKLQALYLNENNIGDDGAKCLSEELKYCPKLQTLNLSGNNIGDDGAKCLSEGLKYCPKLLTLYAGGNSLSYEGKAALEMVRDKINSKRGPHGQLMVSWS